MKDAFAFCEATRIRITQSECFSTFTAWEHIHMVRPVKSGKC